VVLNPSKEFNPAESATYKLLLESENPPDLEKTRSFSTMNEHQAIYAEVYEVPKVPGAGQKPVRHAFPGSQNKAASPRLMNAAGAQQSPARDGSPRVGDGVVSPVQAAALAEGSPASRGRSPRNEPVPLYEVSFFFRKVIFFQFPSNDFICYKKGIESYISNKIL